MESPLRNTFAYSYKGNIYLNITNRCTARCAYCIKNSWQWQFRGSNLKIDHEPSVQEILDDIGKLHPTRNQEIVFC
ncbi:MAG: hypothetical protein GF384_03620, partial [Elusimicrobia bacterium]|nr:hypothetical protein [Elusimicrobiota bacterium]MBD3412003.1 hypothetical protein [Elusimicrobiota bacterium]